MKNVIEMKNITKRFPGVLANDKVNFELREGEIHALLGENGAGKSTLMSILFGLYDKDGGEIFIKGKKTNMKDPNVANALGIGMVHQHFKLVHNYTTVENVILGREPRRGIILDMKKATDKVMKISKQYNLDIDPEATIENISVGMQQRVEIIKMLYRDADILIFDEPTAVLTPQEIDQLLDIMKNFKKMGKSIIIITHKLKEIKAVADRCTILRGGKKIDTVEVKNTSEDKLAELMVGRKVSFQVDKEESVPGEDVLKIDNLVVKDYRNANMVNGLSMAVKKGEILGIAGVDGNGQTELVEAITGLAEVYSGKIELLGKDITRLTTREITETGLAHIPADRQKHGLVLEYTLAENFILQTYYQEPYSKNGVLKFDVINKYGSKLIEEFDIRAGKGVATEAGSLSGGNQQKAIAAREIDRSAKLLIASQPTRGLDVGAIEYIHKMLVGERDKGHAVLLVSFELDEIMSVSDRIAVMHGGKILDIIDADKADEKQLGLLMAGIERGDS